MLSRLAENVFRVQIVALLREKSAACSSSPIAAEVFFLCKDRGKQICQKHFVFTFLPILSHFCAKYCLERLGINWQVLKARYWHINCYIVSNPKIALQGLSLVIKH